MGIAITKYDQYYLLWSLDWIFASQRDETQTPISILLGLTFIINIRSINRVGVGETARQRSKKTKKSMELISEA